MGQVTIYLDRDTEKKLNKIVSRKKISKSKWISELIQEKTANTWPERISALAGAWEDLPTVEEIRKGLGVDRHRESL